MRAPISPKSRCKRLNRTTRPQPQTGLGDTERVQSVGWTASRRTERDWDPIFDPPSHPAPGFTRTKLAFHRSATYIRGSWTDRPSSCHRGVPRIPRGDPLPGRVYRSHRPRTVSRRGSPPHQPPETEGGRHGTSRCGACGQACRCARCEPRLEALARLASMGVSMGQP